MEENQEPPQTIPPQQHIIPTEPQKSRKLIYLIVGACAVLGLGLLGGYLLFSSNNPSQLNTSPLTQITPVITETKSSNINVSPIPTTISLKTYTSTQLLNNDFKPYSLSYPEEWTPDVKKDDMSDTLTLTKDEHKIIIYQAPFGGGVCVFEGDVPEGPASDLRNEKFTEIQSGIGTLRRYERNTPVDNPNLTIFEFCTNRNGIYQSPSSVGAISYTVPKNYKESLIQEMDEIIKTLKEAK